jgi:carbonic anhydrase
MNPTGTRREILRLLAGFRRFHRKFYGDQTKAFRRLSVAGQTPKTLIIACSDSRVDPAILSSANPGELFVVRNVANLVPPYESSQGFHGVSAAIEFAVVNLRVKNIVVLGHRQCGGIRSLFTPEAVRAQGFVSQWMSIAAQAKKKVETVFSGSAIEVLCKECEKESIRCSLENLLTFPFVREAKEHRQLQILGLYFDLELGQLLELDSEWKEFTQIFL